MAYTKSTKAAPIYKTNTKYPKRLSKRESRLYQGAVDQVLNDAITVTASYTPTDEIKTILANGTLTITAPAAASYPGRQLTVYNIAASTVTLTGFDTPGTMDAADEFAIWVSNGTGWKLLVDGTT